MAGRTIQTISTVEGNTAPPLILTCQRQGTPINLTGCSVNLIIANSQNVITNTGNQACSVTDVINGIISYVRGTGDIPIAGTYFGDIQVIYGDGTQEILWQQLKLVVAKKSGSTT